MKLYKYLFLSALAVSFTACNENYELDEIQPETVVFAEADAGSADFSNYVAVGASFSAGVSDGSLFLATQQRSFPAIMAQQMSAMGGGAFNQPLVSDNVGGLTLGGNIIASPRLFFNGAGPAVLPATPTTEVTNILSGPFNNYGIPGAKSFHMVAPGYGSVANVPLGLANPYFARMASAPMATVLGDAATANATFFTISEIGGNDVLAYATSGGTGTVQTGNLDPTTYGSNDITDPMVFANVFNTMVTTLTANGAKGAVVTVPSIVNLPHFTTVPFNPLDPSNAEFAAQIPTLNTVYGALNQIFMALGQTERMVVFSDSEANPVVIVDENLTDLSAQIAGALNASPTFPAFVQSFGLPAQAAPLVANLLGQAYGQSRPATENDLLVLPSSSIIGTVNTTSVASLMGQGLSMQLAGQFSVEGVSLPLADRWVLTPQEQMAIQTATDAYNNSIVSIGNANGLAVVDLDGLLREAATTGTQFDDFTMTTSLVFGGMVSLDGIHLTSRGYALMAKKILEGIDATYGSNFTASGNVPKADNYPTNYPPGI